VGGNLFSLLFREPRVLSEVLVSLFGRQIGSMKILADLPHTGVALPKGIDKNLANRFDALGMKVSDQGRENAEGIRNSLWGDDLGFS
jgi:hypothetical protein